LSTLTAKRNSAKTGKTWTLNWQNTLTACSQNRSTTKGNFDTAFIVLAKRGESIPKDTHDRASCTQ
jgi:hypothetical protein